MMLSLDAILEELARRLAERHELREIGPDLPTHFIFRTGRLLLAMALDDLIGLGPPRLTPVPLGHASLLGVSSYRANFWPVLKLDEAPCQQVLYLRRVRLALQVTEPISLEWAGVTSPPPTVELPPQLRATGLTTQGWLMLEVVEA